MATIEFYRRRIHELEAERDAIRAKTIKLLAQKMEDDGEPYIARKLRDLVQTDESKTESGE